MGRNKGQLPPDTAFRDPREEYVFTTIRFGELLLKWDGKLGHTEDSMRRRMAAEGWDRQKEDFAKVLANERAVQFARKLADDESEELHKAIKRHRQLGVVYQQVPITKQRIVESTGADGMVRKEIIFVDAGERVEMTASDIRNFGKDGVAMERKALGLADEVVRVQFTEEIVSEVWSCVTKYVDDPATLRNLGADLQAVLMRREEALEQRQKDSAK
jgi:hypothetical protein